MKYRTDIDGLRGLALIAIVLFHMDITLFGGGFIGLDLFFVISGFLITFIMEDSIAKNNFSLREFYLKRVRRIFPSFLILLVSMLAIGFAVLLNNEFILMGKSVFNASFFWSNVWQGGQAGYFDKASELKPLLHLWSLAVEVQFYLLWPLIFILVPGKLRTKFFLAIMILSFLFSLYCTTFKPVQAYYLLWSRFWQLGAGCLLAMMHAKLDFSKDKTNFISGLGFALVLFSIFTFNKTMNYPGWRALVPTIGAVCIISAGPESFLNKKILSNRFMATLGLISYPFYLWHWPLLYFVRTSSFLQPTLTMKIAAIALSFLIAYLSTKFLEKKIRTGPVQKRFSYALIAGQLILVPTGLVAAHFGNFYKSSDSLQTGVIHKMYVQKECMFSSEIKKEAHWCESDKRFVNGHLLIGDSHAGALYPGLVKSSHTGESWQVVARAGCSPHTPGCTDFFFKISDELKKHSEINEVLLSFSARMMDEMSARFLFNEEGINHEPRKIVLETMIRFIDSLSRPGLKIKFLIAPPALLSEPEFCLDRPLSLSENKLRCRIPRLEMEEAMSGYYSLIAEIKKHRPSLIVVNPTNIFCDDKECSVVHNQQSFYSYKEHISDLAAEKVAELIRKEK
jgi:peptidoglycan/LPS O-acetylase OafA/YrhL